MANPEAPHGRRLSGEEIGQAIAFGIETGAIVLSEPGDPVYTTEQVAEKLGIVLPDYPDRDVE